MLSEWKLSSLSDCIIHKKGFAFKSKHYESSGTPVVKVTNLTNDTIDMSGVVFVNADIAIANTSVALISGDIIITTVGSWATNPASVVGKTIKVPLEAEGALLNQNAVRLRPKDESINNSFLYYLLKNESFSKYLVSNAQGSANQASITLNDIYSYETFIPLLLTQKKIAHILSTLDDKIELNRKMNQTLEEMAQALFKSWFVDFDPVHAKATCKSDAELEKAATELGISKEILDLFPSEFEESEMGMIPKGWTVKQLSDLIQITGGGTPKRSEANYWSGNIPWFSVKDVPSESDVFVIDTEEKITATGLEKSSTKLLPANTTIITARGTVGKIALVSIPMCMNQSCYGINGIDKVGPYFTYYNLKRAIETLKQNTHGAVFDTITTSTFNTYSSPFCGYELISIFDQFVSPYLEKIKNNLQESKVLQKTRDTLLPKLLSGELDVVETDIGDDNAD